MSDIDPEVRDKAITDYLEASKPIERECRICLKTYTGLSLICGDKKCFYGLKMLQEESRRARGGQFEYQPVGRKVFLVAQLPDPQLPDP